MNKKYSSIQTLNGKLGVTIQICLSMIWAPKLCTLLKQQSQQARVDWYNRIIFKDKTKQQPEIYNLLHTMETILVYEGNFWLLAVKWLRKLDNWPKKVTSWSKYLKILFTTQQCPQIIQKVWKRGTKDCVGLTQSLYLILLSEAQIILRFHTANYNI